MPTKLLLRLLALILFLAPAGTALAQAVAADTGAAPGLAADDGKKPKVGFYELELDKLKSSFFYRFVIDLVTVAVLIGLIYYPAYRRRDYFFTFFMFNVIIFFITYLLNKVELGMGAAFGLFAVFSLLRYRTEDISAKDMTYLFTVIALGLISAVNKGTMIEICIINGLILIPAYLLESNILFRTEMTKSIQYDNIEKIKPEFHADLIADLRARTGLDIHEVSVGRVDYLRDTANVRIYYFEKKKRK